jgi:hypothetical protein
LAVAGGAALCVVGLARAASGSCDLRVDPGGRGTHRSIQAAVDGLPDAGPCTVTVAAGTYRESVRLVGRNARATSNEHRITIVAEGRVTVSPPAGHGVLVAGSRFLTLRGFTVTGATEAAIRLAGGEDASGDITVEANDIHNNASAAADGGIAIGPDNRRTWIVNNLIRNNGRNGVVVERCGPGSCAAYIVNNTIFGNGWNGVDIGRDAEAYAINNLVVGNGTDPGAAGGRFGLRRETVRGEGRPDAVVLKNNIFYGNGGGRAGRQHSDIGNAIQLLDLADADNYTTTGSEGQGIAGCAFPGCSGAAAFHALFDPPGFGPRFRLVRGSPAIERGLGTFVHAGKDWVPDVDFDGDARPRDGRREEPRRVDVGYDQADPRP